MNLDDIRARRWGFAVYALDPSDPVTLEVHAGDGETYTWEGASVEACLAAAFPRPVVSQTPPVVGSTPAVQVEQEVLSSDGANAGGVAETTGGVFD
jgi:hypothetical protein